MDVSAENIVLILTTLAGLAGAVLTQSKYAKAKENLVEFVGDLADVLAMIYAMSKAGNCDAEQLKAIGSKVEELWTDMEALGPTFAALLAQKSSLAESLTKK